MRCPMIHRLTLGHFDVTATLQQGRVVVLRPLEMDVVLRLLRECGASEEGGMFRFGHPPLQFHDNYIVCPWLLPGKPHEDTKRFVRRLQEETCCVALDVTNRRTVELGGND